jgi:hypothetical protein
MEIYNEQMELIENPDMSLGHLREDFRDEYHDAVEGVEEQGHYEVIAEYPNGGKDVEWIVDVEGIEAKDAWIEKIPIQIYVPYTQEELDAMEAEKNKPTYEQRIARLEEENAFLTECLLEMSEMLYA